ncbi:hypothetical protein NQZ68_013011 [Dissostichus eleginoides]|nr:hypothetical protein NQZ68_013011 [Dissostichus eleginoides]
MVEHITVRLKHVEQNSFEGLHSLIQQLSQRSRDSQIPVAMGTPREHMGQESGVVGLSGLGEQHRGAQTGPDPELVQRAKSLCWIKENLCSHALFEK